jgi:hypothetical protein
VKKSELKLCAIVIDGMPLRGRQMIAVFGVAHVAHNGEKTFWACAKAPSAAEERHAGRLPWRNLASPRRLASDHNGDR